MERNCAKPSGRIARRLSRSSSYFLLRATGSKSNPSALGMPSAPLLDQFQYTVLAVQCHVDRGARTGVMLGPEDREARRQGYVQALWRIAERDGADRATMRAIAAEAGTSLGMLQYHFSDKDE